MGQRGMCPWAPQKGGPTKLCYCIFGVGSQPLPSFHDLRPCSLVEKYSRRGPHNILCPGPHKVKPDPDIILQILKKNILRTQKPVFIL